MSEKALRLPIKEYLEEIEVYEAGKPIELLVREYGVAPEDVVKLASNENPLGTSPLVKEAIIANAHRAHLYPDDSMYELKEALARKFGVEEEELIIGAGSDQVLSFVSQLLLEPGRSILTSRVSFAMYDIYASWYGADIVKTESWRHLPEEFIPLIEEREPAIVYLCTPNNPTGDAMRVEDIEKIVESGNPEKTLFVIDGAYMEYAAAKNPEYAVSPSRFIERYPNLLYLGTFSKAYGLGGMRVGYGIARRELISALYKIRPPFNITTLSLAAAVAALEDEAFVQETLKTHAREIGRYEEFADRNGIEYIESSTNFISYLFGEDRESGKIARYLFERGVIIRDLSSYGINGVRITVGTPKQNDRLFEVLQEALS
jgi:histidinol-phosphate aminotransferase